ncbi:MAG: response regulator [Bacteroidia bacterium]|nr:response regulator [Bacteroidia bacterium]
MLRRKIKNYLYPEISGEYPESKKRQLNLIYRIILATLSITLLFLSMEIYSGLRTGALISIFNFVCYLGCLVLFRNGWYDFSRNLFILSVNFNLFLANEVEGAMDGLNFFYFPVATGTLLLFNEKENKTPLLYACLPIALFVTGIYVDIPFVQPVEKSESLHHITRLASLLLSTSLTVYIVYYYSRLVKSSNQKVIEQNASLQTLITNLGDPVWQIDTRYHLVQFNREGMEFLSATHGFETGNGQSLLQRLKGSGDHERFAEWAGFYQRALNNEVFEIEYNVNAQGNYHYYEVRFNPILIHTQVSGVVVSAKNITERKKSENDLRQNLEEKQTLATVASTIQHGILILSKNLNIEWDNAHFIKSTHFQTSEFIGRNPFSLLTGPLSDSAKIEQMSIRMLKGKPSSFETVLYNSNKDPFWSLISTSPVYNEKGEVIRHILICLDISDRKQTEEQLHVLLNQAQKLNKQLASRDNELQSYIRKLNKQSWELQISRQNLQKKTIELEASNKELVDKTKQLEENNAFITSKNIELEDARQAISIKAEQIEQASRYKSEFLANMSHELRTPLNSIIILSRLLRENRPQNLTDKQLEFAHILHTSGTELMQLINDILDLSKIEAGKAELEKNNFHLEEFLKNLSDGVKEIPKSKGIHFTVNNRLESGTHLHSDTLRLGQILRNLLSNAFKFTPAGGSVTLTIQPEDQDGVCFEVQDNGIGIPAEKQQLIFESFRQADGSTNRKYGGTGLGLSISKELTHLLGGSIHVSSEENKGSTFRLILPASSIHQQAEPSHAKKILIIEDDPVFAGMLEKMALKEGYKTEICQRGDTAYMRICESQPDAVLLDMQIPGMNGWNLLKRIRNNAAIHPIPVHVVSNSKTGEGDLTYPVMSWIQKPLDATDFLSLFNRIKQSMEVKGRVLVIEDDAQQCHFIRQLLIKRGIVCRFAMVEETIPDQILQEAFDCIIVDLNQNATKGTKVLQQFREHPHLARLPVIIYSARELDAGEKVFFKDYAGSYIHKNRVESESLLDETDLIIQSAIEQKSHRQVQSKEALNPLPFAGKKVILVRDKEGHNQRLLGIMEPYGMKVHTVDDNSSVLGFLETNPETDLVLLDHRSSNESGYTVARTIRSRQQFSKLAIIAVSHSLKKGERDISLSHGLNEHITAPGEGTEFVNLLNHLFQ